MEPILKAIMALRPGAQWSFDHSKVDITGLTWLDAVQISPTQEELDAEIARQPTIEERVAAKLAERGLTLETEWQLYSAIVGTLAFGALQGKDQATLYVENTGFRNAINMYTDIMFIRSEE